VKYFHKPRRARVKGRGPTVAPPYPFLASQPFALRWRRRLKLC
jgi:hypothetical protein